MKFLKSTLYLKRLSLVALCGISLTAAARGPSNPQGRGPNLSVDRQKPSATIKSQEKIVMPKGAFNPEGCLTGDKKYVYWAAGDQVFRFRFNPAIPIVPRDEEKLKRPGEFDIFSDTPPAPDPSQPAGCYGNPLRGVPVPYMWDFSEGIFERLTGRKKNAGLAGGSYGAVPGHLKNFPLLDGRSQFLESTRCWQRNSGIYECLIAKGENRADYLINRALKVERKLLSIKSDVSDIYPILGYDTRSMVSPTKDYLALEVNFRLFNSVQINDYMRIYPNEIDILIPYLGAVISHVVEARVPNYQWK